MNKRTPKFWYSIRRLLKFSDHTGNVEKSVEMQFSREALLYIRSQLPKEASKKPKNGKICPTYAVFSKLPKNRLTGPKITGNLPKPVFGFSAIRIGPTHNTLTHFKESKWLKRQSILIFTDF